MTTRKKTLLKVAESAEAGVQGRHGQVRRRKIVLPIKPLVNNIRRRDALQPHAWKGEARTEGFKEDGPAIKFEFLFRQGKNRDKDIRARSQVLHNAAPGEPSSSATKRNDGKSRARRRRSSEAQKRPRRRLAEQTVEILSGRRKAAQLGHKEPASRKGGIQREHSAKKRGKPRTCATKSGKTILTGRRKGKFKKARSGEETTTGGPAKNSRH